MATVKYANYYALRFAGTATYLSSTSGNRLNMMAHTTPSVSNVLAIKFGFVNGKDGIDVHIGDRIKLYVYNTTSGPNGAAVFPYADNVAASTCNKLLLTTTLNAGDEFRLTSPSGSTNATAIKTDNGGFMIKKSSGDGNGFSTCDSCTSTSCKLGWSSGSLLSTFEVVSFGCGQTIVPWCQNSNDICLDNACQLKCLVQGGVPNGGACADPNHICTRGGCQQLCAEGGNFCETPGEVCAPENQTCVVGCSPSNTEGYCPTDYVCLTIGTCAVACVGGQVGACSDPTKSCRQLPDGNYNCEIPCREDYGFCSQPLSECVGDATNGYKCVPRPCGGLSEGVCADPYSVCVIDPATELYGCFEDCGRSQDPSDGCPPHQFCDKVTDTSYTCRLQCDSVNREKGYCAGGNVCSKVDSEWKCTTPSGDGLPSWAVPLFIAGGAVFALILIVATIYALWKHQVNKRAREEVQTSVMSESDTEN